MFTACHPITVNAFMDLSELSVGRIPGRGRKNASVVLSPQHQSEAATFAMAFCQPVAEPRGENATMPKFAAVLSSFCCVSIGPPYDHRCSSAGDHSVDEVLVDIEVLLAGLVQKILETLGRILASPLVLLFHGVVAPCIFVGLPMFADVFDCFKPQL